MGKLLIMRLNTLCSLVLCTINAAQIDFNTKLNKLFEANGDQTKLIKYLSKAQKAKDIDAFKMISEMFPLDITDVRLRQFVRNLLVDNENAAYANAIRAHGLTTGVSQWVTEVARELGIEEVPPVPVRSLEDMISDISNETTTAVPMVNLEDLQMAWMRRDLTEFKSIAYQIKLDVDVVDVIETIQDIIEMDAENFFDALVQSQERQDNIRALAYIAGLRESNIVAHQVAETVLVDISPSCSVFGSDDDALTTHVVPEEMPDTVAVVAEHGLRVRLIRSAGPEFVPSEDLAMFQFSDQIYQVPSANPNTHVYAILQLDHYSINVPAFLDCPDNWKVSVERRYHGIQGYVLVYDAESGQFSATRIGEYSDDMPSIVVSRAGMAYDVGINSNFYMQLQADDSIIFLPKALGDAIKGTHLKGLLGDMSLNAKGGLIYYDTMRKNIQEMLGSPVELFAIHQFK